MRSRSFLLVVIALGLVASCGGSPATKPAASPTPTGDNAEPVVMVAAPGSALALCRGLPLVRPACPRHLPIGRYAGGHHRPPGYRGPAAGGAIAYCANARMASVAITSPSCHYESWILEVGAPAGCAPDTPPAVPCKRGLGPTRTRPPQYVHVIIDAARGSLDAEFPFSWPDGPARRVRDRLLNAHRKKPIFLGRPTWAGHRGTLILAPPLIYGGENGDHLIFRWQNRGIDHTISLHSWAPLAEAIATLRAVVASSR